MQIPKIALLAGSIVLLGAGCFGFGGSKTTGADGGVFKTVNGGQTWVQATAVPSAKGVGTIAGTNIITLVADPQDHNVLYVGSRENGMLFSLNAAEAWMQARDGAMREGAITAIAVDPSDVCTVYLARGSRVYKTEDCLRSADSETYVETRASVGIAEIVIDWFNPEIVWLGLTNGDVLKSEDGGETWRTVLTTKKDITALIINNADSRVVLAGTDTDGFYKTIDGGETWVQIEKELNDWKNARRVHALTQDAAGTTVLAASGYGILRSADFGITWEPVGLLTSPGQVYIQALAMDPNNANLIYYAAGGTFYISVDAGANWDTQRLPTTRLPQVMLVDPEDPNVVYVGVATVED